jgi:hypothetical protein
MEYAIKAALVPTAALIAWAAAYVVITNQSGGMFQLSKPVAIVFFFIAILLADLFRLISALSLIALVRDIRGENSGFGWQLDRRSRPWSFALCFPGRDRPGLCLASTTCPFSAVHSSHLC